MASSPPSSSSPSPPPSHPTVRDETDTLQLANTDATTFIRSLPAQSLQCVICDPPFGLDEDTFDKHYARDAAHVIEGYQTAPRGAAAYEEWAKQWIHELPRVLKADGTLYIVCAWNHVCDIELAIRSAPAPGLRVVNHIIWKYNFGVYTQKKFVTSHYHVLRCAVGAATPTFYSRAFFSETERTTDGHNNAQYLDMEDVWVIPKEFAHGERKNVNKLPDALVRKMLLYATKPDDCVGDFFMGNFTTAYVARGEGRRCVGCEINAEAFTEHAERVREVMFGSAVTAEKASTKPKNAGKRLTDAEKEKICGRYDELRGAPNMTKKDAIATLEKEFSRGYFSILNLLKAAGR